MRGFARFSLFSLALLAACGPSSAELPDAGFDGGPLDAGEDPGVDPERCPSPRQFCGAECIDPRTDSAHCGRCDLACADTEVCLESTCVPADQCADSRCGDDCVDLMSSDSHCGECGRACTDEQMCVRGECACTGGLVNCEGVCVDTDASPEHCGLCGRVCTEVLGDGATCVDGSCQQTSEIRCDDMGDDDGDGMVDCDDPDCHGRTRACTCEFNELAGLETCIPDGTWSTCAPDPDTGDDWICAEPECTTDDTCVAENGWGWECNDENICALDPDARFDVVLVSAVIPAARVGDDNWDEETPDPYVWFRHGSASGERMQSSTIDNMLNPTWNEVVLLGARAGDLRSYLELHVVDEDSPWTDDFWCVTRCGDDQVGGWIFRNLATSRFRMGENTVFLGDRLPDDDQQSGFRVTLRFVEPGTFTGGLGE